VASALRTLDAGVSGVNAIATALEGPLGAAFAEAVELIREARGRVIVTGLGKSGHVARKIAATLASTGPPAFFVHAAEASHGDLGMITADDVIMALAWSGEQAEMKNLITYAKRFRIALVAMTSESHSTLTAAAGAGRCARDRAAGRPRLYFGRFQLASARRQARRYVEIYPRPD